ncbi:MAG: hypothetical protein M3Y87_34525, partial [Myxococcota bacterium]|nr:hypothetical protein [Myxococcota bacterium]
TCGVCTLPQTCGGGGATNVCGCTPTSSATACAGLECGSVADGCGGSHACGTCSGFETCTAANLCECTPSDLATACAGLECGSVADGCGGSHDCGDCSGFETCTAANLCECTPSDLATACAGLECGSVADGCGGSHDCGDCSGFETCTAANLCDCTPSDLATACAGLECGSVADGCGGSHACGDCSGFETCGGAGVANECGCTPDADACTTAGAECGTVGDGCGGTSASCGPCEAGETCTANACVPAAPSITSVDLTVLAHGARITITGTALGAVTDVSIDGAMQAIVSATPTTIVFQVSDASAVGLVRSLSVTSPAGSDSISVTVIHLVINELDSLTFTADSLEFVELTIGLAAAVDLTGYHLVLVDGTTDTSYASIALGSTDAAGYLLVGSASVSPDITIADATIQNEVEAAAIVQSATAFADGTAVTSLAVLIDALVHHSGQVADAGLLDALLGPTGAQRGQVNEAGGEGGPGNDSIQRCLTPRLDVRSFPIINTRTPRAPNTCAFTAAEVQARFDATCSGCHVGGGASGGLALDSFAATTMNVPALQLPTMDRIEPGDRAASYLYHKLVGSHVMVGGSGNRMPNDGPPYWAPVDIERFGLYIDGL